MTSHVLTGAGPSRQISFDDSLVTWSGRFSSCFIDLGTGDGRFAQSLARRSPDMAVIGLDTCLDHVKGAPRRWPPNLRYVTADAVKFDLAVLPIAQAVSINFPYGSLLRALIEADGDLLRRLDHLLASKGELVVRVNASAIEAAGYEPVSSQWEISTSLAWLPHTRMRTETLSREDLRRFPSSWARRLGSGRHPQAFAVVIERA